MDIMDKPSNASERLAAALTAEATELSHSLFKALTQRTGTESPYVAATTILSNIGHLLAYAEGNQRHIQFDTLDLWRSEHIDSFEWRLRLLPLLSDLPCSDAEYGQHHTWVSMLRSTVGDHDPAFIEAERQLYSAVRGVRQGLAADRSALLRRLRVSSDSSKNPEARFFRLMSHTASSGVRAKLAAAWDRVLDGRSIELVTIVDEIVKLRWRAARRRGYDSPLAETFQRSTITPGEARTFVTEYLAEAIVIHRRLEAAVTKEIGPIDNPMDHYAYYINRLISGAEPLPLVPLDACLSLMTAVIESVFKLRVEVSSSSANDRISLILKNGNQVLGLISIDLLPSAASDANHVSARDEAGGAPAATLLIGRALCRYHQEEDGSKLVNFEGAHNLFHEMGHALTHVLMRSRQPALSGYQYLPVERLEDLSTWFEKWVYHPELDDRMPSSSSLATCRKIKLLEAVSAHLQRAVTAAIDFDVHYRGVEVTESFRELDKELEVARYVHLSDIVGHLTHPMFRAHPGGAGLTYLWGSAYGAEQFQIFGRTPLSEIGSIDWSERFSSCFDSGSISRRPYIPAVRQFYGSALLD
jgi:oligopeptidase A